MVESQDLTPTLLQDIRKELADQRTLLLQVATLIQGLSRRLETMERRLEDRIVAIRDDLDIMLKAELLGRLAHFETRMEQRIDERVASKLG